MISRISPQKRESIVIRGDWLGKAANINDKNNSAVVYVGSTVNVHNPLFSVGKLLRNKLMQKHITKESDGFHNHSTQLAMVKVKTTLHVSTNCSRRKRRIMDLIKVQ